MPRQNRKSKFTPEQLAAFEALWASNMNIRQSSIYSVAISRLSEPQYIEHLTNTLGGELRVFTAKNGGKEFNGWFLSSQDKLEIMTELEAAGHLQWLDEIKRDVIREKLRKAGAGAILGDDCERVVPTARLRKSGRDLSN